MKRRPWLVSCGVGAALCAHLLSCSGENDPKAPVAGAGGQAPSAGSGGSASGGVAAQAGAAPSGAAGALSGGAAGLTSGGVAGTDGSAGSVRSGAAGTANMGGAGIAAGTAGMSGASGATAGTAGGGTAGTASAGTAGAATGGTAGTPSGGTAGGAGAAGGAGKVVLFDGASLDAWESLDGGGPAGWKLVPEASAMEVVSGAGNIITKQRFGSMLLHVEYWTPSLAASVTGQSRGNSGIYIKRAYELQVLDSFGVPVADDTCGAIYKTSAPLVSACFGAETWNTYEIEFKDSTWSAQGTKTQPAVVVSAHLNGELVQQNVPLTIDPTQAGVADEPGPQPLMLQDHDPQGRVRYRNIWALPRED